MLFKCRAGIAGCRFECYFSSDNVRLLITGEVFVRVKLERRAGPATVIAFALLTERNKFFRIAILLNVLRGRERDDMVREFIHFFIWVIKRIGDTGYIPRELLFPNEGRRERLLIFGWNFLERADLPCVWPDQIVRRLKHLCKVEFGKVVWN